jgi:hypothetical protein
MNKIVYGVKEKSNVCQLIFPETDQTGFSSLVNQTIIKNDMSEEAVGKDFYGIGFKDDSFVFSKTRIVYDGAKRIGYLSFILTLKNSEVNVDLFDQIQNLEKDYFSKKLTEQNDLPEAVKYEGVNNKSEKGKNPSVNAATLYNSDEELKNNFHCLDSYKNYHQIYFIKPEDRKVLETAIKYDRFFDNINELKEYKEIAPLTENNKKPFGFKSFFRR